PLLRASLPHRRGPRRVGLTTTASARLRFAMPVEIDPDPSSRPERGEQVHHPPTVTLEVAGLGAEAEILVDRWGIPHIYAGSQPDALFVQGFNAARDRLWQIDLWRKRGLVLLAGDFGESYVERDRAARLLPYPGDMDADW